MADGYRNAVIAISSDDPCSVDIGAVRLESLDVTRIQVRDAGQRPVPGAVVRGSWLDGAWRQGAEAFELGVTGKDGVLEANVGRPVLAFAHAGFRVSGLAPCAVGAQTVLDLSGLEVRVGLRAAATERALSVVGIDARCTSGYPILTISGATAIDGLFDAPLPLGRYYVTLRSDSLFFESQAPNAQDHLPGLGARAVAIELASDQAEPLWLAVTEQPPLTLEVRDRATGQLVPGAQAWVSSWEAPPFVSAPGWTRLAGEPLRSADGRVSLHSFGALHRSTKGRLRLSICAAGYRIEHLEDPLLAVEPRRPFVVLLGPGVERSVRLRTRSGDALRRQLWVLEDGVLVGQGWCDSNGASPEFAWSGGDVSIRSGADSWSPLLASVSTSTLRAEVSPLVVVDADAEIRVRGSTLAAPALMCASETREKRFARQDGHDLVFDQLPPGRYEVGPPESLASLELRRAQGLDAYSIELASGEARVIFWADEWTPVDGPLTGRVVAVGLEPSLVQVVPRWGPSDQPLAGGDRLRRFPVAADGSFELVGVRTRPSSLMFVREWLDGGLLPLGWGVLGENVVLNCAPAPFSVEGSEGELVRLSFTPGIDGRKVIGSFNARLRAGTEIDLGPLPVGTESVRVVVGGRARDMPLRLRAGEPARIRIE